MGIHKNTFLFFPLLICLIVSACSEDDDGTERPCTIIIEGKISDEFSGDPIDSAKVYITPVIIFGQPEPPGAIFQEAETYTDTSGKYLFDLQCDIGRQYVLGVTDNERNRFYWRSIRVNIGKENSVHDIELCAASFLKINRKNIYNSDQLSYQFNGLPCDNNNLSFGFSTPFKDLNDTTELIKLPSSSELFLRARSFSQGFINLDTIIFFAAGKGDTTEIYFEY